MSDVVDDARLLGLLRDSLQEVERPDRWLIWRRRNPDRELIAPAVPIGVVTHLVVQLGQSVRHEMPVVLRLVGADALDATAERRSGHGSAMDRFEIRIEAFESRCDRIPPDGWRIVRDRFVVLLSPPEHRCRLSRPTRPAQGRPRRRGRSARSTVSTRQDAVQRVPLGRPAPNRRPGGKAVECAPAVVHSVGSQYEGQCEPAR